MADIKHKGRLIQTSGHLPPTGFMAPNAVLVNRRLKEVELNSFEGWRVLNVFPSIDTGICAMSVRQFNKRAGSTDGVKVLNISADLPFAFKRFCGAEGLEQVRTLSSFRSDFAREYGLEIVSGPLKGLCSRAVLVVNPLGIVTYSEQVPEIAQEPDYAAALDALPCD